jgi:hypothetical protein
VVELVARAPAPGLARRSRGSDQGKDARGERKRVIPLRLGWPPLDGTKALLTHECKSFPPQVDPDAETLASRAICERPRRGRVSQLL